MQLGSGRGGKRKGAGRKPKAARAGVEHRRRSRFERRTPVHVTLRVCGHVWNLRSRRSLRVLAGAICAAGDRFGARIVQFTILGNHVHLLVEAENTASLVKGMKGLSVRIAKGMNGLMGRKGRVVSDRYHSRVLRTPTEVRNAKNYIRHNYRHHFARELSVMGRSFQLCLSGARGIGGTGAHVVGESSGPAPVM